MSDKKIGDYDFVDHGIDTASYFPGAGTGFTKWDECFVGVGSTPAEAAEDAIEMAAQSGWDTSGVEVDATEFPENVEDSTAMHLEDCPLSGTDPNAHDDDCAFLNDDGVQNCTCDCICYGEAPQCYVVLYVQQMIEIDTHDPNDPANQDIIRRSAMREYDPNADPITL